MPDVADLEYPQPEFRDRFRSFLGAVSDAHPVTSVGMNFFNLLLLPSIEKRRDRFLTQVGTDLAVMAGRVHDLEDRMAGREDTFATITLNAAFAAVKTTDEAKLQRLRNAAVNAAAMTDVDASMGEMFIQAVSDLTPLHIEVLTYLSDPAAGMRARDIDPRDYARGPRKAAFSAAFPGLGLLPHEMGGVIMRELYARGFILTDEIDQPPTGETLVTAPLTTDIGLMFLAFINPSWPSD